MGASGKNSWIKPVGWILTVLGGLAAVGRVWLVQHGILYGGAAVARVDEIVGSCVALGAALVVFGRSRSKAVPVAAKKAPAEEATSKSSDEVAAPVEATTTTTSDGAAAPAVRGFADRVALVAALGSVVTLLVTTVNLFWPAERPGLAASVCAGTETVAAKYVGFTSGPDGDNSRSGPAQGDPANGRFAASCSIGFSAYCLGDPITDPTGTTTHATWVTSRWLLVAKQPPGLSSFLARLLSGENPDPQFVSDAYVNPETPYPALPPGRNCGKTVAAPGPAVLQPFDVATQTLTARADHAANMGFAVWVPLGQDFLDPDHYEQIYDPNLGPAANPGQADASGRKTVAWAYHTSLLLDIPGTARIAHRPEIVVVLAIPCLADNIPARTPMAALAAYDINSTAQPQPVSRIPPGLETDRLARTACQASS
jgi:hypothetical protein